MKLEFTTDNNLSVRDFWIKFGIYKQYIHHKVSQLIRLKELYSWIAATDKPLDKCSKVLNSLLFLFSNKMLIFKAGSHTMLLRIANR